MTPFDFQLRTRIVFGPGVVKSLGELAVELGARRALVVSDPGIVAVGHVQRGLAALDRVGIEAHLFDGVEENPSTTHVEAGLAVAKKVRPELLVGLGGGSSLDCAKGINFLYSCGGRMQDYWGVGKATRPMLPMIGVPTTAGTGSEAQSYALIADAETRVKMACGDKRAACRVAILDPELTLTQSPRVTALTGIDALAHAVETFVTNRRTPISLAFSRQAWTLLSENFPRVLVAPDDVQARGGMLAGACLAGLAIENSMLGAAHALANPLTTSFGVVHGQAVGLMLPHVVRFNAQQVESWYGELTAADHNGHSVVGPGASRLAEWLTATVDAAGLATRLSACGVQRERLGELAEAAARQWTCEFNPRKVTEADLLNLYEAAW